MSAFADIVNDKKQHLDNMLERLHEFFDPIAEEKQWVFGVYKKSREIGIQYNLVHGQWYDVIFKADPKHCERDVIRFRFFVSGFFRRTVAEHLSQDKIAEFAQLTEDKGTVHEEPHRHYPPDFP